MDTDARPSRPTELATEVADARVASVLEILGGEALHEVAARWVVDPALLERWVSAFVEAGTAQVTNCPDEKSAHQRDRFLGAFAHELRTPLGVAQGWARMLRGAAVPQGRIPAVLQRLCDALDRLADRTFDVELLAACSMGRLVLNPAVVQVTEVADGLVGVSEICGEGGGVEIEVDTKLFPLVLRDLWQAGATHPAPRSLGLEVRTVGPWVEIRVMRDGDPIDPSVLRALFEPFDLNDDGTGVTTGLYLARALTVAHGGALGVDQDKQGSAFWVRVPRRVLAGDEPSRGSRSSQGQMFTIACGDVMPGCAAEFRSTDRDELLGRVARHAASGHDILYLTAQQRTYIESRISVAA